MTIMSIFIRTLFCEILNKVNYTNIEVLNNLGSCLICSNHSSVFDPLYVFPVKQEKDVYIMAKSELFKNRIFRWLADKYNVFPIDRKRVDFKSLLKVRTIFKNNSKAKLIMFPEGRIIKNSTDVKKYYKKGAVFIAAHSNVPIVPVKITRRPKLFQRVDVIFGEPIYIKKEDINDTENLEKRSKELIEIIYNLEK